jgi:hypothetical protein
MHGAVHYFVRLLPASPRGATMRLAGTGFGWPPIAARSDWASGRPAGFGSARRPDQAWHYSALRADTIGSARVSGHSILPLATSVPRWHQILLVFAGRQRPRPLSLHSTDGPCTFMLNIPKLGLIQPERIRYPRGFISGALKHHLWGTQTSCISQPKHLPPLRPGNHERLTDLSWPCCCRRDHRYHVLEPETEVL